MEPAADDGRRLPRDERVSEILRLADHRAEAISRAVEELGAGQLVVAPTDTVYGLLADALNPLATALLFEVKRRRRSLPLAVLASSAEQAWGLAAEVPPGAARLAKVFWPGPLTIVLARAPAVGMSLGDDTATVALRVPDHEDLRELIRAAGPVAATSANISGSPTPRTVEEIAAILGDRVAILLDGGPSRSDLPSTIVDLTGTAARVIREGVIPAPRIEAALA